MTDTLVDPLPPLKPHERHPVLETDVFCLSCGYNLHSQPVMRDERLGILVCRCPECGRFHPAGTGLTAASLWMSRMATALLVLWVLVILFAIFWIVMGMGGVAMLHLEQFSYLRLETSDGQAAEYKEINSTAGTSWTLVKKGTTQPLMGQPRQVRVLDPRDADTNSHVPDRREQWQIFGVVVGMAAGLGFLAGALLVIFLWHWKRRSYRLALLLPLVVAVGFIGILRMDNTYMYIFAWAVRTTFGYAALMLSFMWIGTKLGRPIARGCLRMFIPPKPRQHFAFLWLADGKSMPPATIARA